MKRFKNIVIGGIESKVFNLILVTILLLAGAYTAISLFNSRTLSTMVSESGEKQQTAISETTSAVMDEVVSISLERANRMNARVADEMFSVARDRVVFLTDYAEKLFAAQKVFIDGRLCPSGAVQLKEGDTVSVRGFGRFIYRNVTGSSKKGRSFVCVEKYI